MSELVLIKGAGDLATGVALRLHRAGFPVVMTEIEQPLAVRRTVAFAQAVFDGACRVEEITAQRATMDQVEAVLAAGAIPVLVDPGAASVKQLQPAVLVDAIMAKVNTGTGLDDAPLVIALGPGFTAGIDCHAVIETNRGHALGRVLWQGSAEPNTGEPGELAGAGKHASRVLRAPAPCRIEGVRKIGDYVEAGERIAYVNQDGARVAEISAPFAGVLRGLIHPNVLVPAGTKIGDLDPRADSSYCFTVSDKALAMGGAVLEAVLMKMRQNGFHAFVRRAGPAVDPAGR